MERKLGLEAEKLSKSKQTNKQNRIEMEIANHNNNNNKKFETRKNDDEKRDGRKIKAKKAVKMRNKKALLKIIPDE